MKKPMSIVLIVLFLLSVLVTPVYADDQVFLPLTVHIEGASIRFYQYNDLNGNHQYDGGIESSPFVGHLPPFIYRFYHAKCLIGCEGVLIPEFYTTAGSFGKADLFLSWGTWLIKTDYYGITHPCHYGELTIEITPNMSRQGITEVYVATYENSNDPCPL